MTINKTPTTVETWVSSIKESTEKLNHWLTRQYVGEMLAASRIRELVVISPQKQKPILQRIADDEAKHASWVKELLVTRGMPIPEATYEGTRYWEPILKNGMTATQLMAAGAHAEEMRLHRIRALAEDSEIDQDIRDVFQKILPDEEFHAKAFAGMAGAEEVAQAEGNHQEGLLALGLEL
jgi:rubrerythrin